MKRRMLSIIFILESLHGSYLKSDIIQIAHHGISVTHQCITK